MNVNEAEESINDLRRAVTDLESDFERFLQSERNPESDQKLRTLSELVTQTLVKVDNVEISKDIAADALRNGDRGTSRKFAVLLSRRKSIVKRLNNIADRIDKILNSDPEPDQMLTTTTVPTED